MTHPSAFDSALYARISRSALLRGVTALALLAGLSSSLVACSSTSAQPAQHASSPSVTPQQSIVDRSAAALARLRQGPNRATFEAHLRQARGVMVFPRLVKASFLIGGEGGNGVLVVKRPDGTWSNPAFYSLGSPSIGLQVGYQEATVVLFIMDERTIEHVVESTVELGTKSGVTVGSADRHDDTEGHVFTKQIYQMVDAEGAYAGVSLDGYVIGCREKHNFSYYGPSATPRAILRGQVTHRVEADILGSVLAC